MRLFHISESDDIKVFHPRILAHRTDIDQGDGWVWAVEGNKLYNFFFPTNCPRGSTFKGDGNNFLSGNDPNVVVYVEEQWMHMIKKCQLTCYEFDTDDFVLQDEIAGYYISTTSIVPKAQHLIDDCIEALKAFDVTIKVVDNLWPICDAIEARTNNFSFRKMKFAKARD